MEKQIQLKINEVPLLFLRSQKKSKQKNYAHSSIICVFCQSGRKTFQSKTKFYIYDHL